MMKTKFKLGDVVFKVIATPFHTKGSCCFYVEKRSACFSQGDTLFHLGIGRSDLARQLPLRKRSPRASAKLAALPISTKVYPGHGEMTEHQDRIGLQSRICGNNLGR
jgi:glyoxylase-like metal-dependent hydrolase (beta-lactamase superfamily II)